MKINFNKNDLVAALNISLKAIPTRTTMPILECILIEAGSEEIKFTSNDMEMGIETIVNGEVVERGKIAVNAKLFSEIVRKLPDSVITLESDENMNVTIRCEKARFNISGQSGEEFAYLPSFEKKDYISLSQYSLKEIIQQTIFSIAQGENNKLMTGELFEVNENVLRVVSLDGHRISIRKVTLKDNYGSCKVVVPGKTLNDISRILGDDREKEVLIFFGTNYIMFEFDRTIVMSRLIEGQYFKIDQMLSSDYDTRVTLNKKEMQDCIDRSMLMVRENDKKPIIMNVDDVEMELSISSAIGSMKEEIPVEKRGKDIRIGFNPRFLMDALRVIDDEDITLYMINSKAPCFIRDEEQNYIYLILPVNIESARV